MSDGWDGSLETKVNTVVNGLRADNSTLLGEHLEPTDAPSHLIVFNTFQVSAVDDDVAW